MTDDMSALCMGVHVLDVLVRPVEAIPEGHGGELVEEIRITAAGSAGGTALVLAKLGASVRSAGAIGRDAAGDMLVALLERDGVDTELLVRRDEHGAETVPAFEVEAVDTTGCGDAFSAGFLRGLALGRDRHDAAVLGCAAAALVAQGLGTDHGDFDLAAVERMAA